MLVRAFCALVVSLIAACSWSQEIVSGRVIDSLSREALIGTSISWGEGRGAVSDSEGRFRISIPEGTDKLEFSYIGFTPLSLSLADLPNLEDLEIRMHRSVTALDEIVVSAGRYEQKLSDVMVSVDIIKPDRILASSTTSLESIIRQTPGVEVRDGQPSIRGGSGYSYGAGSRVMVLLDGLPVLSGDVGDVKWDYLPVENIEQVEIIKGASSVLYGSSALNGVLNLRTRYPLAEPATSLSLYSGLYLEPARKETAWWGRNPFFGGFDFSHRRRIRTLELVIGGSLFRDEGYREDEYIGRARMSVSLKRRSERIRGFSYGLNMNGMELSKSDFLLWRDSKSGALRQNPQSVSALVGNRFNLDPFLEFRGSRGGNHSLRSRVFHIENNFADDPDKNNRSDQLYAEYKFHRSLREKAELTAGFSSTWMNSDANLYGDHGSFNAGLFGQGDVQPLEGLKLSVGLRLERYVLDGEVEYSNPLFRAGMNYRLAGHTWLRASFGEGYRFPSVAEKFTATSVGSLKIFPNPALVSETGWSSEIGIKQGLGLGEWSGYADLSLFWTEYSNMIEFVFDLYQVDTLAAPTLDDYGFMAQNQGEARIRGLELSLYGNGRIGKMPISLMAGYTLLDPVDLAVPSTDPGPNTLKYRIRHSLKADAGVRPGRFEIGGNFTLNGKTDRVDEVFTNPLFGNIILPGFPSYWEEKNRAYAILDLRVLCNITSFLQAGIVLKNALNKEFLYRPGDIRPPRNITLRMSAEF